MGDRTQGYVTRRQVRLAALGGVVGPFVFVLLVIIGGIFYDGYSHTSQKISELGGEGSSVALLQNVNFILLGLFTLAFAWALGSMFGEPYTGAFLIGFFAVSSAIANGLLPCDLGCRGRTPVALAHNITGSVGFLAAIAGMAVFARRWRTDPRWQAHVVVTKVAVGVTSVGLIWFILTQALDRRDFGGVAQRTFVAALLAWIVVTGWRIYRELGERPAADPPTRQASSS